MRAIHIALIAIFTVLVGLLVAVIHTQGTVKDIRTAVTPAKPLNWWEDRSYFPPDDVPKNQP